MKSRGFFNMLQLVKNQATEVYFTGTELATIASPYFLFVFTHRVTGEKVKINAANESTNERVDKATLTVDGTSGIWVYRIYQKSTHEDETESGVVLEDGYMNLSETVDGPVAYDEQSNDFKTYEIE